MNHAHDALGRYAITHGQYHEPEYHTWASIIQRCTNPKAKNWWNYGGRGIEVCHEWRDFSQFLADMGKRPSVKHSIDRIDNGKGYYKDNCRWATRSEQSRNTRLTVRLTFHGETKCLTEWAEQYRIKPNTLYYRVVRYGWTDADALLKPVQIRTHRISSFRD